jgi:hypothetical protein
MVSPKKPENSRALFEEDAKCSKELVDDDLSQIVGGAFNPTAVSKYGLDVITVSGVQGLKVRRQSASGAVSELILGERTLREHLPRHSEWSFEVKNNSGDWITLGRDELTELIS